MEPRNLMPGLGAQFLNRMNALSLVLFAVPTLAILCSTQVSQAKSKFETFETSLVSPEGLTGRSIAQEIKLHQVNAVGVAIIENGRVVKQKAYGYLTRKKKKKATTKTMFQVASLSKLAAGIAAAEAHHHGKLKLDESVSRIAKRHKKSLLEKWIKRKFKKSTDKYPDAITPRRLFNHSAGLNMHGIGTQWRFMTKSMKGIMLGGILTWTGVKPKREPGIKYEYSGGGFTVGEHIIELETKKSFSKWTTEQVLTPLKMSNSTYKKATPSMKHLAHGCSKGVCGYKVMATTVKAAGGLMATAGDYARMVTALMNFGKVDGKQALPSAVIKNVLTASMASKSSGKLCSSNSACGSETCYLGRCQTLIMEGSGSTSDGLGVEVKGSLLSDGYHRYVAHGGAQTGFRAKFYGDRQKQTGIVILVAGHVKWTKKIKGKKYQYGAQYILSEIFSAFRSVYLGSKTANEPPKDAGKEPVCPRGQKYDIRNPLLKDRCIKTTTSTTKLKCKLLITDKPKNWTGPHAKKGKDECRSKKGKKPKSVKCPIGYKLNVKSGADTCTKVKTSYQTPTCPSGYKYNSRQSKDICVK